MKLDREGLTFLSGRGYVHGPSTPRYGTHHTKAFIIEVRLRVFDPEQDQIVAVAVPSALHAMSFGLHLECSMWPSDWGGMCGGV